MADINKAGLGLGGDIGLTHAGLRATSVGDSTLKDYNGGGHPDMSSGSGAGAPRMVARTLAREIELKHPIGKGRYGEVRL